MSTKYHKTTDVQGAAESYLKFYFLNLMCIYKVQFFQC